MRIGIDLDTALIDCRRPLSVAAERRGLLPSGWTGDRAELYRRVMALPGGAVEWRRLLGLAQGPLLPLAEPMAGASAFLAACRDRGFPVFLFSLRPPAAAFDAERTDLWGAATTWLARFGAFRADGFAIPYGNLIFAAHRRARLDAIAASGCSHFIEAEDEETRDPFFVTGIERLLIGAAGWAGISHRLLDGITACR